MARTIAGTSAQTTEANAIPEAVSFNPIVRSTEES